MTCACDSFLDQSLANVNKAKKDANAHDEKPVICAGFLQLGFSLGIGNTSGFRMIYRYSKSSLLILRDFLNFDNLETCDTYKSITVMLRISARALINFWSSRVCAYTRMGAYLRVGAYLKSRFSQKVKNTF